MKTSRGIPEQDTPLLTRNSRQILRNNILENLVGARRYKYTGQPSGLVLGVPIVTSFVDIASS